MTSDTFDYSRVVVVVVAALVAAVALVVVFSRNKMEHSRIVLEMSLAYCDIFFQEKKENRTRKRKTRKRKTRRRRKKRKWRRED